MILDGDLNMNPQVDGEPNNFLVGNQLSVDTYTKEEIDELLRQKQPTLEQYLKSASVDGNTLTLLNKDGTPVKFTPQGESGGGDNWRFIRSVTLTTEHIDQDVNYWTDDAGNVCGFEFDKDSNGDPFSCNDILCVCALKGSQNAHLTLFNGTIRKNATLAAFRNAVQANSYKQFQFRTEVVGDYRFFHGESGATYANQAVPLAPVYLVNIASDQINKLRPYFVRAKTINMISMYSGVQTASYEGIMYFWGKN